jgi:hypothetical protein
MRSRIATFAVPTRLDQLLFGLLNDRLQEVRKHRAALLSGKRGALLRLLADERDNLLSIQLRIPMKSPGHSEMISPGVPTGCRGARLADNSGRAATTLPDGGGA